MVRIGPLRSRCVPCIFLRRQKPMIAAIILICIFIFIRGNFEEESARESPPDSLMVPEHVTSSDVAHAPSNQTEIQIQKVITTEITNTKYVPSFRANNREISFHGCGEECSQLSDIRRHVNCAAIMEGDRGGLDNARRYMKYHPNPVIPERVRLHTDCGVYRNNPFYRSEPNGDDERNFSVAYSIVVHKNPVQLERLIRAIYWPQNTYCIHVDKKAPSDLYKYVTHLSNCFQNVIMTKQEDVVYGSYTRLKADLNCMQDMLRHNKKWKYLINLTGQEFPLKTNREIVKILQIYNGSNDIEGMSKHTTGLFASRFEHKWKVRDKIMVKDKKTLTSAPPGNITLIKGSAFGVFSRAFMEFVFSDPTVKRFLVWLQDIWSPDEFFWATLNSRFHNGFLRAPGGYDAVPERKPWLAKYAAWPPRDKCSGKKVRGICIFSSGDLPALITRRELFANKFYIERDYMVLHCLEEWIRNKTLHPLPFDYQFYRDLPFINRKSKIL